MQAGDLKYRVRIEKISGAQSAYGDQVQDWSLFKSVRANIEPLAGNLKFQQQQIVAGVTHTITIRYLAGVTPKMRIVFGSRIFTIETVLDIRVNSTRHLELNCTELV